MGAVESCIYYGGTLDTTYYVTLTVFNDCGDSSLTLPVYVEPNTVQAAFGMDKSSGCSPLTVNTNYSYNTTNTAWCFDWDVTTNTCNGGGSVNQIRLGHLHSQVLTQLLYWWITDVDMIQHFKM